MWIKNGFFIIVWRCSYCIETLIPLGTVAILLVSVSVSVSVKAPLGVLTLPVSPVRNVLYYPNVMYVLFNTKLTPYNLVCSKVNAHAEIISSYDFSKTGIL